MSMTEPTVSLGLLRAWKSSVFRFAKKLFGAAFLSFILLNPALLAAEPRFGLWVESEGVNRPFVSEKTVRQLLDYSAEVPLSDLYCQVYRNGRSWYPSMMADDTPYRLARQGGTDPLRRIIDESHKRGQKVHAWFNVLRIISNRNAPLLRTIGAEAVLKDSDGNSLLKYNGRGVGPGRVGKHFQLGTQGYWLEAGSVRVRQYIVETIRDLVLAYPDIDGIHLDMVRFPISMRQKGKTGGGSRPSFGFSEESLGRFFEFTGRDSPSLTPSMIRKLRHSKSWKTWKRAQVTLLVFQIKEMLNSIAPQLELSAAVVASPHRSYNEAYQDWGEWMKGGIVQTVLPMAYTKKTNLIRDYTKHATSVSSNGEVIMGLGAWLMKRNTPLLAKQGQTVMRHEADGVILFSYSNLFGTAGKKTVVDFGRLVFPVLK